MTTPIVSAVFDTRAEAERAVSGLRAAGVRDNAISLVAQHDGDTTTTDAAGERTDDDRGDRIAKGATVGLGAGALLGFGALLIPGVGPFIAAGALAETLGVAGGAIATGAVAGTAVGGLAGALKAHGVSDEDSRYYEDRITAGGTFVSVRTGAAGIDEEMARDILYRSGGHSASRARTTATV